ncbi:ATP-binding cassette domain-containing protein [Rhodococcus sp. X156]|uniref:sulfate/molybdate ABC transporter ATP-binding protein n=1 Tax=Rhodococcus sp. X156 TaxID=2499145 RepID=UPI0019CFA65D|nr:ATP-binding cassette domain-containing protein [Rhodococcus sp. X156]
MRTGALAVRAQVAARGVELELEVGAGEVVAVLGPNGAGKSTLLSVVAGLLHPDEGRVSLDGRVLLDTGTGTRVPPHRRGVALLAQDPLLFPHLSVADNVAFGPRSAGQGRRAAATVAARWLAEVGATELAGRRPAALSGGQAQRVAVARALAAEPALLLLDEPMAALDVGAAPAMRSVLRRVLREEGGRSALLVTHDVLDALVLADRVVVVEGGQVVEAGPAAQVLSRPRSSFAARIAGLNLLLGTVTERGLRTASGTALAGVLDEDCRPGQAAVAVFDPLAVAVHVQPPGGSPRNAVPVRVTAVEPRGQLVRVRAVQDGGEVLLADVTTASVAELDLVPGHRAYFVVKAAEVRVHLR